MERLTAGSTAARKEMPPYYAQNNDFLQLTSGTHRNGLYISRKNVTSADSSDPPAISSHARKCLLITQKKISFGPKCHGCVFFCSALHVQSTFDACRSLTTLTRPRREHQGGGRRRGLGRERHGGREDSTIVFVSHAEGSTTVRWFTGSSAVAGE